MKQIQRRKAKGRAAKSVCGCQTLKSCRHRSPHYFGFPMQPLANSRIRMFDVGRPTKRCSMLSDPDEG